MDYRALAVEMLQSMAFRKMPTEKHSQMNSGERGILSYLRYVKDGILAGELSHELGVTTGRMAIALKSLEKKGMIVRSASRKDRRCTVVCITPEGARTAEAFYERLLDAMEQMLCALGEQDAREYVRIMQRIAALPLPEENSSRE